jgi:hypothetical protein
MNGRGLAVAGGKKRSSAALTAVVQESKKLWRSKTGWRRGKDLVLVTGMRGFI